MKRTFFLFLLATTLLATSCDEDPYPLNLDRFDVRWYDDDHSGTHTLGDALTFDIYATTTDPDTDDQKIQEWEFSYTVNGKFGGILLGDDHAHSNSITANLEIAFDKLALPGPGQLSKGDVVEFRLWAIDNHDTELERYHRHIIEE